MPASPEPHGTVEPASATQQPAPHRTLSNLPRRSDDLFGRQADVAGGSGDAARPAHRDDRRCGGIGKTRVAEAAAAAARSDFADGVWWVELASITDPALVPTTVARALGLSLPHVSDTLQSVIARVGQQQMLIVLDNCEHLLESVATFVDAMLSAAPRLRILVTSQEVLRASDEAVYRLGTLSVPTASTADAVSCERLRRLAAGSRGQRRARLCSQRRQRPRRGRDLSRLDGIPLAIELAAARVPLLGIEGVRAKLDERFRMLTAGARVVLRRHQTLRAALEWSHALLTEEERIVFRRLGVFAGGFTLESAQRVADDENIDAWDVLEHLGALVDKSLVLAEGEPVPRLPPARDDTPVCARAARRSRRNDDYDPQARGSDQDLAARDVRVPNQAVAIGAGGLGGRRRRARQHTRRACMAEDKSALNALHLELAIASLYTFTFAHVIGEGFRRMHTISRSVDDDVSPDIRAHFWLAYARVGNFDGARREPSTRVCAPRRCSQPSARPNSSSRRSRAAWPSARGSMRPSMQRHCSRKP